MGDKSESSSYLHSNQHPDAALCRHSRLFSTSSRLAFEHLILQPSNVPAAQSAEFSAIWILTHIHCLSIFKISNVVPLYYVDRLSIPKLFSALVSLFHITVYIPSKFL